MGIRQRELAVLLITVWACSGWLADEDRIELIAKVCCVSHAGGISGTADDYVKHSFFRDVRAFLKLRDDVFATSREITAAVLTHIYYDALYRVVIDEVKNLM